MRSVWLVGLPGAGKSDVGPLLAGRLGWDFLDLDRRVEELAGRSVAEIFARGGEAAFRALEAEASREAMARRGVVVATGGGWMARADLERTVRGCIRVWLRVRPETAIHRLSAPGAEARPLLAGDDPAGALRRLLSRREGAYAEAELSVDTDELRPAEVAEAIFSRLGEPARPRPIAKENERKP